MYHYSITVNHYLWDAPRKYHGFLTLENRIESVEDYENLCNQLTQAHGPSQEHIWNAEINVDSLNYLGSVENQQ